VPTIFLEIKAEMNERKKRKSGCWSFVHEETARTNLTGLDRRGQDAGVLLRRIPRNETQVDFLPEKVTHANLKRKPAKAILGHPWHAAPSSPPSL
jgi:hypothetical protein